MGNSNNQKKQENPKVRLFYKDDRTNFYIPIKNDEYEQLTKTMYLMSSKPLTKIITIDLNKFLIKNNKVFLIKDKTNSNINYMMQTPSNSISKITRKYSNNKTLQSSSINLNKAFNGQHSRSNTQSSFKQSNKRISMNDDYDDLLLESQELVELNSFIDKNKIIRPLRYFSQLSFKCSFFNNINEFYEKNTILTFEEIFLKIKCEIDYSNCNNSINNFSYLKSFLSTAIIVPINFKNLILSKYTSYISEMYNLEYNTYHITFDSLIKKIIVKSLDCLNCKYNLNNYTKKLLNLSFTSMDYNVINKNLYELCNSFLNAFSDESYMYYIINSFLYDFSHFDFNNKKDNITLNEYQDCFLCFDLLLIIIFCLKVKDCIKLDLIEYVVNRNQSTNNNRESKLNTLDNKVITSNTTIIPSKFSLEFNSQEINNSIKLYKILIFDNELLNKISSNKRNSIINTKTNNTNFNQNNSINKQFDYTSFLDLCNNNDILQCHNFCSFTSSLDYIKCRQEYFIETKSNNKSNLVLIELIMNNNYGNPKFLKSNTLRSIYTKLDNPDMIFYGEDEYCFSPFTSFKIRDKIENYIDKYTNIKYNYKITLSLIEESYPNYSDDLFKININKDVFSLNSAIELEKYVSNNKNCKMKIFSFKHSIDIFKIEIDSTLNNLFCLQNLEIVNLNNNKLTPYLIEYFGNSLNRITNIRHLYFRGNSFKCNTNSYKAFANGLSYLKCLQTLDIAECMINDEGIILISKSLNNLSYLMDINISSNQIEDGICEFTYSILNKHYLEKINISKNIYTLKAITVFCTIGLVSLGTNIKSLDVSDLINNSNFNDNQALFRLTSYIKSLPLLEELNISNNTLTDLSISLEYFNLLNETLGNLYLLKRLNISYMGYDLNAFEELISFISKLSYLEILLFYDIKFPKEEEIIKINNKYSIRDSNKSLEYKEEYVSYNVTDNNNFRFDSLRTESNLNSDNNTIKNVDQIEGYKKSDNPVEYLILKFIMELNTIENFSRIYLISNDFKDVSHIIETIQDIAEFEVIFD